MKLRETLHFWTSKNCIAIWRASPYFLIGAPGGPGTGAASSECFDFFFIVSTTAATTTASTIRTMIQPHHPLDLDFSPILFSLFDFTQCSTNSNHCKIGLIWIKPNYTLYFKKFKWHFKCRNAKNKKRERKRKRERERERERDWVLLRRNFRNRITLK